MPDKVLRLGFASVSIDEPMFPVGEKTLGESWDPSKTVNRYGRDWRMSRPRIEGSKWFGRIGFVSEGAANTLQWNDNLQDFVTGTAPAGSVSPFVIDLDTHRVVFQVLLPDIKPNTFPGALQALLNKGSMTYTWRVSLQRRSETFDEWRATVKRVTQFRFTLRRPNPNYDGRERIERLIEDLDAVLLRLQGKGDPKTGVDTDSDLFRQAMDHVRRKYGEAMVKGIDRETDTPVIWRSQRGGQLPIIGEVRVDEEEPSLATEERLATALATPRQELESGDGPESSQAQ